MLCLLDVNSLGCRTGSNEGRQRTEVKALDDERKEEERKMERNQEIFIFCAFWNRIYSDGWVGWFTHKVMDSPMSCYLFTQAKMNMKTRQIRNDILYTTVRLECQLQLLMSYIPNLHGFICPTRSVELVYSVEGF